MPRASLLRMTTEKPYGIGRVGKEHYLVGKGLRVFPAPHQCFPLTRQIFIFSGTGGSYNCPYTNRCFLYGTAGASGERST
jgi:hypothetical protein